MKEQLWKFSKDERLKKTSEIHTCVSLFLRCVGCTLVLAPAACLPSEIHHGPCNVRRGRRGRRERERGQGCNRSIRDRRVQQTLRGPTFQVTWVGHLEGKATGAVMLLQRTVTLSEKQNFFLRGSSSLYANAHASDVATVIF